MATTLRFFTGDENGFVKSAKCKLSSDNIGKKPEEIPVEWTKIDERVDLGSVQRMTLCKEIDGKKSVATSRGKGSTVIHSLDEGYPVIQEWSEPRFKSGDRFVGLHSLSKGTLTCTSNGHLCLTSFNENSSTPSSQKASAPMRLTDLRVSEEESHFAYGGNEVELSVWDVEKTFSQSSSITTAAGSGTKRKKSKSADLFPSEIWRAKNLPNDFLSLRQPVHITSLAFLKSSGSQTHHLVTGTHSGAVRRYDTRAARRPVNNWEGIGKSGGVRHITNGLNEHQIFVSDNTSSLLSLDLRTGRPLYSYHHISGSVTSIAPTSTNHVASVSLDRFFRIHTAPSPPPKAGENQSALNKASVVVKAFTKGTPSIVIWGGEVETINDEELDAENDDDEIWENMPIGEDEDEDGSNDEDGEDEDDSEDSNSGRLAQRKRSRLG